MHIQLEAICLPKLIETWKSLMPYLPELKQWDPRKDSNEIIKQIIRDHLTFDHKSLISYLHMHPEKCRALLDDSYNKHYSPATFIAETDDNQYRVGWAGTSSLEKTRVFTTFAEATADYVLFSWGLQRLT